MNERRSARTGLLTLLVCGLASCGAPSAPADGWEIATPLEAGLDSVRIQQLEEAVTSGRFENLHGVVVAKGGRLVLDAYGPGVDGDELHYTASVTKSIGGILLGIAIDGGYLRDHGERALDLGLLELFPEHEEILRADPRKPSIRLRHVLEMTAGLAWDEDSHPYDDPRNDWVRVRESGDAVRLVLEQPVSAPPGSEFTYSGGMSTLVGALVDEATDGAPQAFAEKELFGPLGITEYTWWNLEGGLIDVPGGLHLRSRDMAKIGQLFLQRGSWRGEQIVSASWVAESTALRVRNSFGPGYGLHWWVGDHHFQERSTRVFLASGHGGQRICVIPEFDLVVVVVQQVFDNPMSDANNLAILSRYVLPAAAGSPADATPIELEPDDLRPFAGHYRSDRAPFTVELRDGALWALSENTPPLELEAVSRTRFRALALGLIEVDFDFDVGPDGAVTGGRSSFGFTEDSFRREAL